MSRKLIAMFLIAAMLLAGCSSTKPEPEKPSQNAETLSFNGLRDSCRLISLTIAS